MVDGSAVTGRAAGVAGTVGSVADPLRIAARQVGTVLLGKVADRAMSGVEGVASRLDRVAEGGGGSAASPAGGGLGTALGAGVRALGSVPARVTAATGAAFHLVLLKIRQWVRFIQEQVARLLERLMSRIPAGSSDAGTAGSDPAGADPDAADGEAVATERERTSEPERTAAPGRTAAAERRPTPERRSGQARRQVTSGARPARGRASDAARARRATSAARPVPRAVDPDSGGSRERRSPRAGRPSGGGSKGARRTAGGTSHDH
ncbi:MAG TPA: hypothetical protein VGH99_00255 [Pseudonocardia sp.]|jgi:hypothetical protein